MCHSFGMKKKNIVCVGGGTGIYPVLQGLKQYHAQINTTAVISMADSGGSNARIRDEFGLLPLSDINRALAALSTDYEPDDQLLRQLFLHRFEKGDGVTGHNFGNLLLVALTDILGSEAKAIKAAARILRVRGQVLPVTTDTVDIVAQYDDGVTVVGEHDIDEPAGDRVGHRITKLCTQPKGSIAPDTRQALLEADLILIGPGDIYSSLLANIVIDGVSETVQQSAAQVVYAVNLMTRPGQTDTMTAKDHIQEIERYLGRKPDTVIVNTGTVSDDLLKKYADLGQEPVVDDCDGYDAQIIRADLLSSEVIKTSKADVLIRSLVRGDGDKFAALLLKLLQP